MSEDTMKYNRYFNLEALAHLDLIMEDKEYWMTSLQLAEISGRRHADVLRDIERDLIIKKEIYENKIKKLNTEEDFAKYFVMNAFDDIKIKKESYFNNKGRKDSYYKLNRNAALFCLARYNFITQVCMNKRFLDYIDTKRM